MATDVTMPRLSDSMEEGTILKWIVEEGGEVKRGEPLCEIETDKANMTYEADTSGTVIEIVVPEGETVALGEVIARIGEPSEAQSDGGPRTADGGDDGADEGADEDSEEEPQAEAAPEEKPAEERSSQNGAGDGERVKASPVAKRMAQERGIDLASISGSGPGGRIVKADVEAAASGDGAQAEEREGEKGPAEEGRPRAEGEAAAGPE